MPEFLRSPWAFPFLAFGPALIIWFLVEALPGRFYRKIKLKGKRRYVAIWACVVAARLYLPGLEPAFSWTATICCALIVLLGGIAYAWMAILTRRDEAKVRRLKRQTCS